MDQIITGIINVTVVPITSLIAWAAENGLLFVLFLVLWVAFAAALIWNQGSIDQAWAWIQGQPLILQVVLWLLFLPVMAGLWIWETTWPFLLRIVVVLGIAGWNLLVFLPKALQAAPH